ncbi:MAG: ribosome assembly RNA-binding protein YhbY [Legionellales bacterium]|nr:ribosome assembly RNA-binding protein YhbY [Legionellales bacterium]|tara:strand:- start:781 stop:1044 length:264 start_codon:yes stop_codon:yes gene_type:complete
MTPHEKKALAAQVHHLKPVVIVGAKGLTDAVLNEIDAALTTHELIKIRLNGEREDRQEMTNQILAHFDDVTLVKSIGHVIAIYRKNP